MNVLLRILVSYMFIIASASCSNIFLPTNCINIKNHSESFCIDKNTGSFVNSALDWGIFNVPKKYNIILSGFHKYITTTDLNSISEQLPTWYPIIGYCRLSFILNESYYSLLKGISYESLPDNCKKLLLRNIKELNEKKCDIKVAQKLSVLTAINTSWEDTLSSMKTITEGKALSHRYTLTEALFILHLKPSKPLINYLNPINYLKRNNYENKDVLFYAECITGALACVLKHDKKIPTDFEFDLIQTSDSSWRFMKNAKKLMQAYKDTFTKEQNKMNIINNKSKEEDNKEKVYNVLQDEERIKLKQD